MKKSMHINESIPVTITRVKETRKTVKERGGGDQCVLSVIEEIKNYVKGKTQIYCHLKIKYFVINTNRKKERKKVFCNNSSR